TRLSNGPLTRLPASGEGWGGGSGRLATRLSNGPLTRSGAASLDPVDPQQALEPGEVVGIAGVEIDLARVSDRRDHRVRKSAVVPASNLGHGRHDDAEAARGVPIEIDGFEQGLGFLEPRLTARPLARVAGEMWPGSQLRHGHRRHPDLVRQGLYHGRIIPINDHGGVHKSSAHRSTPGSNSPSRSARNAVASTYPARAAIAARSSRRTRR